MTGTNSGNSGSSFTVSVGKEIDAALGDVIRGLLKKPAEEAGNLLGHSIGILSDRVKRKREFNTQHGIEKVRKNLEDKSVDMKDITPPKEEELYLLINGLSLTDDEIVRDMWAGLFAKALEPGSSITAERSFIGVLENLSSIDAKIIDFLAFIIRTEEDLKAHASQYMPKDLSKITPEENEKMNSVRKLNLERQKISIKLIEEKAEGYGLKDIFDSSWAENLMRQGVIERTPLQQQPWGNLQVRTLDDQRALRVVEQVNKKIAYMEEAERRRSSAPERLLTKGAFGPQLQLEVQLTSFGKRFAEACGLLRS